MALQGCIGERHLPTAIAIARFKLMESGRDWDEIFAELDRLWKVKHGHRTTPAAPKGRVQHDPLPANRKWCNGCERGRLRAKFSVDRSRRDGLNNRCRDCAGGYFKQTQSRRCKKCGMSAVGTTCIRCYKLAIAMRGFDYIELVIPHMLREWRESNLSKEQIKTYNKVVDLAAQAERILR
jgi:hypothetical protein